MLYGKLLTGKGMAGMLGTVWLIICALTFGGVMERSGFLAQISRALLPRAARAGLVTATATTSVFLNVTASDQYLAIVVRVVCISSASRTQVWRLRR